MLSRRRSWLILEILVVLMLALMACDDGGDSTGPGVGGTGGQPAGGYGGAGGGAGGAGGAAGPQLVLPEVLALPYTVAGAGGSSGTFAVQNSGTEPATAPGGGPLEWTLSGDPRLSLVAAPQLVEGGGSAAVTLEFDGAAEEEIVQATLAVEVQDAGQLTAQVFAVAGDPGLGSGVWDAVELPGAAPCGEGLTLALPAAPFPHYSDSYTDDSVRIFVPEGFRDRGAQDLVVHFHGHNATLAGTLASHLYQEHICASGVNAVLVVPQGPVSAPSGNFGKLMDPGGLERLLVQVLVVLYREGRINSPVLGDLVLTSHSGGYAAVATNLDPAVNPVPVRQIDLFDSVYAYEPTFVAFAEAGGILRSNYTPAGGTTDNNQAVIATLQQDGYYVATEPTQRALRDEPICVYAAATSHNGATRLDGAYGEQLRWGLRHHRRGPRLELREAVVTAGTATVRWLSPPEEDLLAFRVETSDGGGSWTVAAEVGPGQEEAAFALASAGALVRVVPVVPGLADGAALPSDVYRLDEQPELLVVDGFDRLIDGSFGGLQHALAALVATAAGRAASVSNEAVTEDGFDLAAWPAVVWLLGDESVDDHVLSAAEQQSLESYLTGGGVLIMSGSEAAYALDFTAAGAGFLAAAFGAQYGADDSGSYTVLGVGPLAGLGSFTYGGAGAAYEEDYPDALVPVGPGETLLQYGTSLDAAVGIAGQGVLVGFPLELCDQSADLQAVMAALRGYAEG